MSPTLPLGKKDFDAVGGKMPHPSGLGCMLSVLHCAVKAEHRVERQMADVVQPLGAESCCVACCLGAGEDTEVLQDHSL